MISGFSVSAFQFFFGGKGIRTPDIQLAKLALYQLSYAPALRNLENEMPKFEM